MGSPRRTFLRRGDEHLVDMRVVGLHVFARAVFFVGVEDDDDVSPAGTAFLREEDAAVRDRVNGIAEVAVLAADAVEVVAEMAVLGERLRVVGEGAVLAPERKIETRGGGKRGEFERRGELKCGLDLRQRSHFRPERNQSRPSVVSTKTSEHRQDDARRLIRPCSFSASSLRSRDAHPGHRRRGLHRLAPGRETTRCRT